MPKRWPTRCIWYSSYTAPTPPTANLNHGMNVMLFLSRFVSDDPSTDFYFNAFSVHIPSRFHFHLRMYSKWLSVAFGVLHEILSIVLRVHKHKTNVPTACHIPITYYTPRSLDLLRASHNKPVIFNFNVSLRCTLYRLNYILRTKYKWIHLVCSALHVVASRTKSHFSFYSFRSTMFSCIF